MEYAYNEEGRLIDGVTFRFNKGDDGIAIATLTFISVSGKLPTSIIWNDYPCSPSEALHRLNNPDALEIGYLALIFGAYDHQLLKSYLDFLRESYPAMLLVADEIDNKVFGTKH